MKNIFSRFTILVILASCSLWIKCGNDDNLVDSSQNVKNTDYVAERPFSFTVAVENRTQLRLEAISGNVVINGISESDSVLIRGERIVGSESTEDAEEHLQELQVSVEDLENEVFVKTVQPEETYGRSYVVHYDITLPRDFRVLAGNVNGTVRIDSINNRLSVNNVNGQIMLDKIHGSVSVNLVNGLIQSEVTLPSDGAIDMSIVNGSIELSIPENTSAEFSATVTIGDISVSNLVLQNQESTPNSLRGTLGAGQGTISLSTVNGNIRVTGF